MSTINWKKELDEILDGDVLTGINIAGTLYDKESLDAALDRLDVDFEDRCGEIDFYGETDSEPFWAWSKEYVYFCVEYDGSEWISRVPRNQSDGTPTHIGEE